MDLDRIIEKLNKREDLLSIHIGNLEDKGLTEVEKTFFNKYRPEHAFVVYGTLAPNRPNYHIVEHINGTWTKGIIRGKLDNKGWAADLGYFAFKHCKPEEQTEIEALVISSEELIDNWQYLDEFEGPGYRRILTKFELENGDSGVGYIYAANEQ